MPAGRPPKYETVEQLEAAIEDYFYPYQRTVSKTPRGPILTEPEKTRRQKPTITGLAFHLGFESRQSFYDYEKEPEFSYTIKRARLRVEMNYEEKLHDPAATGAIFALKNLGWTDKTEMEHSGIHNINFYASPGNDTIKE